MREARGTAVDEKDKARGSGGLPLRVGRKVICEGVVGTFYISCPAMNSEQAREYSSYS